jgi:hypothetical protein
LLPWLINGPRQSQNQDLYQFLNNFVVMPALVAGIHVLKASKNKDMGDRNKPGHDATGNA